MDFFLLMDLVFTFEVGNKNLFHNFMKSERLHLKIKVNFKKFLLSQNFQSSSEMSLFVLKARKYIHGSKEEAPSSCGICKLKFGWENGIYSLPCGHYFHQGCLQMFLAKKTVCPVCKLSLTDDHDDLLGFKNKNTSMYLQRPPTRREKQKPFLNSHFTKNA